MGLTERDSGYVKKHLTHETALNALCSNSEQQEGNVGRGWTGSHTRARLVKIEHDHTMNIYIYVCTITTTKNSEYERQQRQQIDLI
jgi:hypothetical protein